MRRAQEDVTRLCNTYSLLQFGTNFYTVLHQSTSMLFVWINVHLPLFPVLYIIPYKFLNAYDVQQVTLVCVCVCNR